MRESLRLPVKCIADPIPLSSPSVVALDPAVCMRPSADPSNCFFVWVTDYVLVHIFWFASIYWPSLKTLKPMYCSCIGQFKWTECALTAPFSANEFAHGDRHMLKSGEQA